MTSFKSLHTKKYVKSGPVVTPDTLYWKKLSVSTNKHNLKTIPKRMNFHVHIVFF